MGQDGGETVDIALVTLVLGIGEALIPGCEAWEWVQERLADERERRLAYLLYQCGLQPVEVVRRYPQEWHDVGEVKRLRRKIVLQLSRELGS